MKTFIAVAMVVLPLSAWPQSPSSTVVVKELVTLDNAQALAKARDEAVKSGLAEAPKSAGPAIGVQAAPPPPPWKTLSIFGAEGALKADMQIGNESFLHVGVGSIVKSCRIKAIAAACVQTENPNPKKSKAKCPKTVCWTGEEIAAELRPQQQTASLASSPANTPRAPLPSAPIPLPSGSAVQKK